MSANLDEAVALTNKARKAQSRARGNNRRDPKPVKIKGIEPTPEQQKRNGYQSAGPAKRTKPVIDTLKETDRITIMQWKALDYYASQAIAADKSPIKSNIDFTVRTGGARPIGHQTPQQAETGRIEANLGKLAAIVRAVCVDNLSLTEWCIETVGGREKGGRIVPKRDKDVDVALLELRYAAGLIVI